MINKIFFFLLLLIVFLTFGCGKRTSPRPRSEPDGFSPVIKLERTRFRGEDLVLDWRLIYPGGKKSSARLDSERDISAFRFYILPEPIDCDLCRKKTIGQITFYPSEFKNIENKRREAIHGFGRVGQPWLKSVGDSYQALIPARFFKARLLKKNLFLGLDYITEGGMVSPVLQRRFPPCPLKIPVSRISVVAVKSLCRSALKSAEVDCPGALLKLSWTPRREALASVIFKNGRRQRMVQYYKLNLYRVSGNSKEKIRRPLNSVPLSGPDFSLSGFHDFLYARFVDRFGNESEEVLVFDGVYR